MPRHSTRIEVICLACKQPFYPTASMRARGAMYCCRNCYESRRSESLEDRLCSQTIKDQHSDCILWTGNANEFGYGDISIGRARKHNKVTRVAYEIFVGPFDPQLFVLHACDNPPCIKPAHLFLGTHQENMDDMTAKGRRVRGESVGNSKLTEQDVHEIRKLRAAGRSMCGIGKQYGVARETIRGIVNREYWVHVS